jgi:peroxiredoxin
MKIASFRVASVAVLSLFAAALADAKAVAPTVAPPWKLMDVEGKPVTLAQFKGKVVILDFWATWCPPCRKEMPDLDVLYQQFKSEGLVILAISDEEAAIVKAFIAQQQKVSYPVLLDPGRRVNGLFRVEGIPKTFVYDRSGKLAAQSIDMRTRQQFLEMLAQAGLRKRSKRS